ncbi:hypothetical protein [Haloarcula amylolytica]|uniref:hypothetical protein n=1 Tax=Haloarcula amylolytica TaxID=396317 RepID=UPI003C78E553
MSNHESTTGRPSGTDPSAAPLVSSAQLSIEDYPSVHINEERFYTLQEWARCISETTTGTAKDHLTGLLGEDALAQQLGITDDLTTEVYPDGGDGGVDLQYHGMTIDVKTVGRHNTDPALTVGANRQLTADYYVLASRVGQSDVRLIGYAPREFITEAPTLTHEGRSYHRVTQECLFPIPEF